MYYSHVYQQEPLSYTATKFYVAIIASYLQKWSSDKLIVIMLVAHKNQVHN